MKDIDGKVSSIDVSREKIHWDLDGKTSYGSYLELDSLLSSQHPKSTAHDEMMFIIIHQQAELWMKLSLYEVDSAIGDIRADHLGAAMKKLARQAAIQKQLISSWDVLSTLTPADYMAFRDDLGPSSGFQSHQYRQLEFVLGNKNAALIEVHAHQQSIYALLKQKLHQPSLYDEAIMLLVRRGFDIPSYTVQACQHRDWSLPYATSECVEEAWKMIYSDTSQYWDLYYLAEKLVDLEDRFQQWRFRHMKTVERIIGLKPGTGGSSGVAYLQKALALRFFPELWQLRTSL